MKADGQIVLMAIPFKNLPFRRRAGAFYTEHRARRDLDETYLYSWLSQPSVSIFDNHIF